jgi:hypothetical protein
VAKLGPMWLQHVKGRNNMKAHIPLLFDGRYQKKDSPVNGTSATMPAGISGLMGGW